MHIRVSLQNFVEIGRAMRPDPCVWVFLDGVSRAPGGVFSSLILGEAWIAKHGLTGSLTAYPIDEGSYDWAIREGAVNMKPEKLQAKLGDADFISSFCSASQEHYHYEEGEAA